MMVIRLGIARGRVSGERQGVRGKVLYKERERHMREAESGVGRMWVQERSSKGQITDRRAVRESSKIAGIVVVRGR